MMTPEEILVFLHSRCGAKGFLQVSAPLVYAEEGPFVFSLAKYEGEYYCFAFEIQDAARFLADPAAQPSVFSDDGFYELVARNIDFSVLLGGNECHALVRHKIIPDEPACRMAVQELWRSNPREASRILMVAPDGNWFTCDDIRDMPTWLS